MANTIEYLETLMREPHKSETEIMALALQTGLRQIWRDHYLGRYLCGELTRGETIAVAGLDWVEMAERQQQAMLEDIAWAMEK